MEMVQPHNYYNVQGWMVTELGLKGNELHAYAIIYGFSQDGVSEFVGSINYLSRWLGCSRRSMIYALDSLVKKGLVSKRVVKDGINPNGYKTIPFVYGGGAKNAPEVVQNLHEGSAKSAPGVVQNLHGGSAKSAPNNNRDTYIDNYKDINISKPEKPAKKKYGEYGNVLLTDEELDKLKASYPTDWQERIDRLSEYIASKGASYKSHYATINAWARRETGKQAPAGRTGTAGRMVGPNGIAIDPTKNDLDGYF